MAKKPRNNIESADVIREIPEQTGGAKISAQFFINKELGLTVAQITRSANASKAPLRRDIQRMVRKEYAGSGLRKITGTLLAQALNKFKIEMLIKGAGRIVMTITWTPTIEYFFIHLLGGDINRFTTTGKKKLLFTMKRRNFLRFTNELLVSAETEIERHLQAAGAATQPVTKRKKEVSERAAVKRKVAKQKKPRRKKAVSEEQAVLEAAKLVESATRRPTKFKLRKQLRRAGISAPKARKLIEEQFQAAVASGLLTGKAIGLIGVSLQAPQAKAIVRSIIAFNVLLKGRV